MIARIVLGVVLAGIVGCTATGLAVLLFGGGGFPVPPVLTWGGYGVAIAIAVLLPIVFSLTGRLSAMVLGFVLLDLVASAVAIFVFGVPRWQPALAYDAVYALFAVVVYAGIAGSHAEFAAPD